MRAIVCPAYGAALDLRDIDPPPLGPTQVRIRVAAAGVNFADTLFIQGKYQEKVAPPAMPGKGGTLPDAPGTYIFQR